MTKNADTGGHKREVEATYHCYAVTLADSTSSIAKVLAFFIGQCIYIISDLIVDENIVISHAYDMHMQMNFCFTIHALK